MQPLPRMSSPLAVCRSLFHVHRTLPPAHVPQTPRATPYLFHRPEPSFQPSRASKPQAGRPASGPAAAAAATADRCAACFCCPSGAAPAVLAAALWRARLCARTSGQPSRHADQQLVPEAAMQHRDQTRRPHRLERGRGRGGRLRGAARAPLLRPAARGRRARRGGRALGRLGGGRMQLRAHRAQLGGQACQPRHGGPWQQRMMCISVHMRRPEQGHLPAVQARQRAGGQAIQAPFTPWLHAETARIHLCTTAQGHRGALHVGLPPNQRTFSALLSNTERIVLQPSAPCAAVSARPTLATARSAHAAAVRCAVAAAASAAAAAAAAARCSAASITASVSRCASAATRAACSACAGPRLWHGAAVRPSSVDGHADHCSPAAGACTEAQRARPSRLVQARGAPLARARPASRQAGAGAGGCPGPRAP